ncbi:hypothetical protein CRENBAI_008660, partial [Crenichthys baileyi]
LRPQKSNTYAGFSLPDSKPSKFSRLLQDQFRQGFSSPRSVQSSTFNSNPAVNSGSGLRPSTRRYTPLSQPAQSSRRLGQSSMVINPTWQKTYSQKSNTQSVPKESYAPSSSVGRASASQLSENKKEHFERKVTLSAQQGTWGSPRESFSLRLASHRDAEQEPSYKRPTASSATLFGPVVPGPRKSSVWMQTYAQAPARRLSLGQASSLVKARSLAPQTAAWKQHLSPQFALNVGGSRPRSQLQLSTLAVPRSSRVGISEPGFAPVTVYELPEPFGGSAIRRLKRPEKGPTGTGSNCFTDLSKFDF